MRRLTAALRDTRMLDVGPTEDSLPAENQSASTESIAFGSFLVFRCQRDRSVAYVRYFVAECYRNSVRVSGISSESVSSDVSACQRHGYRTHCRLRWPLPSPCACPCASGRGGRRMRASLAAGTVLYLYRLYRLFE